MAVINNLLSIASLITLITFSDFAMGYLGPYYERWRYEGILNPLEWRNFKIEHNECGGHFQSPINIDTSHLLKSRCTLSLINHQEYFFNSKLKNEGHNVNLILNEDSNSDHPMLQLSYPNGKSFKYMFNSIHFHFGSSSDRGSEHLINGHQFPMEMHSVYYSPKYNTFENATRFPDGLVVVATLYYICDRDNPRLWPIISKLKEVIAPLSSTVMSPFILEDLIPFNRNGPFSFRSKGYYKYHGSLTTPPCSEAVTWFVLKTQYPISESQISVFRLLTKEMHSENGEKLHSLADNYRPIQPLNNRAIFEVSYF